MVSHAVVAFHAAAALSAPLRRSTTTTAWTIVSP